MSGIATIGLIAVAATATAAPQTCTDLSLGPCNFVINPSENPDFPPTPPPTVHGASGSYSISIASTGGNAYSITVTGNSDGNGPTGPLGSPNGGPQSTDAKAGVDLLSLTATHGINGLFFTAPPGASGPYDGSKDPINGQPGNLGGHNNLAYGTTTGVWQGTATANDTAAWSSAPNATVVAVAPHGGNQFLGSFNVFTDALGTTPGTLAPGTIIRLSGQDNGQQWSGLVTITPEPSALALVLPGLAPLGLALRRRRRTRS